MEEGSGINPGMSSGWEAREKGRVSPKNRLNDAERGIFMSGE
jgi:hypothetical protein